MPDISLTPPASGEPIAIVGMACRFPDAADLGQFLELCLTGRRAFRLVPPTRFTAAEDDRKSADRADPPSALVGPTRADLDRLGRPGRGSLGGLGPAPAPGPRTAAPLRAALIEGWKFDRAAFGVSDTAYQSADPAHWLALETAARALADAGLPGGQGLARDRTGVIIGNTLTGEAARAGALRSRWPYVRRVLSTALAAGQVPAETQAGVIEHAAADFLSPFPQIRPDSLAGSLPSAIADRICGHFGFRGGGHAVDSAHSSSLLSVAAACSALAAGEVDAALAGGVDISLDPFEIAGLAKAGVLAESEMRVFDARPTGFWPGEGCGLVVLMRAVDARAASIPIYAEIVGWGVSSAGSPALTRPGSGSLLLALRRAYQRAAVDPAEVQLIEGDGAGTASGDLAELTSIAEIRAGAPRLAALGSVKANIGHTKAAAGVAGLVKATLAVAAGIIPPTTGCVRPHPLIGTEDARVRVPRSPEPWPEGARLAGVSAVGPGGTSVHLVLRRDARGGRRRRAPGARKSQDGAARPRRDAVLSATSHMVAPRTETFVFAGPDRQSVAAELSRVADLAMWLSDGELHDLACEAARRAAPGAIRVTLVASAPEQLSALARDALPVLYGLRPGRLTTAPGIYAANGARGRVVLLFPGEGASPQTGARTAGADPGNYDPARQPAIVSASLAALRWLDRLKVTARAGAGHGLGEITGLVWAGCLPEQDAIRLVAQRASLLAAPSDPPSALICVDADAATAQALGRPAGLATAADNGPRCQILAGTVPAVRDFTRRLAQDGIPARVISAPAACYSSAMADRVAPLRSILGEFRFRPPSRRLISTITGAELTADDDVASLLCTQLTSPVRFAAALNTAAAEADLLLEMGPGESLSLLAADSCDTPTVSLGGGKPDEESAARVMAALFAAGAVESLLPAFARRSARPIDIWRERAFIANPLGGAPPPGLKAASPVSVGRPPAEAATSLPRSAEPDAAPEPAALPGRASAPEPEATLPAATSPPAVTRPGPAPDPAPATGQDPAAETDEADRRSPAPARESGADPVQEGAAPDASRAGQAGGGAPPDAAPAPPAPQADQAGGASPGSPRTDGAQEHRRRPGGRRTRDAGPGEARADDTVVDLARSGSRQTAPEGVAPWVRVFTEQHLPLPAPEPSQAPGPWRFRPAIRQPFGQMAADLFTDDPGADCVLAVLADPAEPEGCETLMRAAREGAAAGRLVVITSVAGLAGFCATLRAEHPALGVTLIQTPENPAGLRVARMFATAEPGRFRDIRIDDAGVAHEPVMAAASPPADGTFPLGPADVVLVSGVAGIGELACAASLSSRGAALAVIASPGPEDPRLTAYLSDLRESGIRVSRKKADPSDPGQVAAAVRSLERSLGPVTAVVHAAAAGLVERLATLPEATVRAQLASQRARLANLLAAIAPERVRLLLTFGSVSARYGRREGACGALLSGLLPGQAERLAAAWPQCKLAHVDWAPWLDAPEGADGPPPAPARRPAPAWDVTSIPVSNAWRLLHAVLASPGFPARAAIHGRTGVIGPQSARQRNAFRGRFLESTPVYYPGIELIAETGLSLSSDPYLADHRIDGLTVLPAAIVLEAMAQAAAALAGAPLRGLTGFSAPAPVVLPPGGDTTLRVGALRRGGGVETVLRCAETGFRVDHARAVFHTGAPAPVPPPAPGETAAADAGAAGIVDGTDLYGPVYFQTGRFRRVAFLPDVSSRSCRALVRGGDDQPWFGRVAGPVDAPLMLGSPGLNDATLHVLQACLPHRRVLPAGCESVTFSGREVRGALQVYAERRPGEPSADGPEPVRGGTEDGSAGQAAPRGRHARPPAGPAASAGGTPVRSGTVEPDAAEPEAAGPNTPAPGAGQPGDAALSAGRPGAPRADAARARAAQPGSAFLHTTSPARALPDTGRQAASGGAQAGDHGQAADAPLTADVWDVRAVDATGEPVSVWRGVRLRDLGPLARTAPWHPALLAVCLEGRAAEFGLAAELRAVISSWPPAGVGGAADAGGAPGASSAAAAPRVGARLAEPERPDSAGTGPAGLSGAGQPPGQWAATAAGTGPLDGFELSLQAARPVSCAWEAVGPAHPGAGGGWELARLRQAIAGALHEPGPAVAARIRTLARCLAGLGLAPGAPLAMDDAYDGGWIVARGDGVAAACAVVEISGVPVPVAVAIGARLAADGAAPGAFSQPTSAATMGSTRKTR